MKVDNLDQLFGTQEFEHLRERGCRSSSSPAKEEAEDLHSEGAGEARARPRMTAPLGSGYGQATDPPTCEKGEGRGNLEGASGTDGEGASGVDGEGVSSSTRWFPNAILVLGIVLGIACFVVVSVVSLHVKMRKNALSYELSAQTRMMRRLEKRKAMYELEYSFLRSSQSIQSKVKELGWKEITPHSIKFIKPQDKKRR